MWKNARVFSRTHVCSLCFAVGLATTNWSSSASAALSLGDAIEEAISKQQPTLRVQEPTTAPLLREPVSIRYTGAQIDSIMERARAAWKGYRRLRPRLRAGDDREQAFAHRAAAMRYLTSAVARLLQRQKRRPTRDGPQTIAEAMLSLDRATAAVEHDIDRVVLRMAQEALLPPGQPFCLCAAPTFARISPAGPTRCDPSTEVVLSLAQGEGESFQLVVVPFWKSLRGVRVEMKELFRRGSLDRLGPDNVSLWLVQSVVSTPTLGCARFWPDPLTPLQPFDVPATATQAILVDVRAEPNQAAGLYEGRLTVSAQNTMPMSVALRVFVLPFSLPDDVPEIAFHVENGYLQNCFGTSTPMRIVQTWNLFLSRFGLNLYRPVNGGDASATGRVRWLGQSSAPLRDTVAVDPYGLAAASSLPYRQAGWMAWSRAGRYGQVSCRWLASGWATVDPCTQTPRAAAVSPLVRALCRQTVAGIPPGLIYLTSECVPQPTLRLIALRDGIEDYRYLEVLARDLQKARLAGKGGWWNRRKWSRLLTVDPKLGDPAFASEDTALELLSRRQAIAEAILAIRRELRTIPPPR